MTRKNKATARSRFKFDETRFHPGQREAAIEMVEYEFSGTKERKKLQDIADQVGISRRQLHTWNTQDQNFIAYKNSIASDHLDSHLAFVYRKLLDGIADGSMKGIETYMKRIGDLDSRTEVTLRDNGDDLTQDERLTALKERIAREESNK